MCTEELTAFITGANSITISSGIYMQHFTVSHRHLVFKDQGEEEVGKESKESSITNPNYKGTEGREE